jgi:hypothetical protein
MKFWLPRLEPMGLPSFYPILDTEVAARHGIDPVSTAASILEAGAQILQFRHKGFLSREIFERMERIAALCRQAGAPFVVNDRADLARLMGAALHLGQDDLPPTAARRLLRIRNPSRETCTSTMLKAGTSARMSICSAWRCMSWATRWASATPITPMM